MAQGYIKVAGGTTFSTWFYSSTEVAKTYSHGVSSSPKGQTTSKPHVGSGDEDDEGGGDYAFYNEAEEYESPEAWGQRVRGQLGTEEVSLNSNEGKRLAVMEGLLQEISRRESELRRREKTVRERELAADLRERRKKRK